MSITKKICSYVYVGQLGNFYVFFVGAYFKMVVT